MLARVVSRFHLLTDRVRRNEPIRRAHLEHGYSLTEIGRAVGLLYATIAVLQILRMVGEAQDKCCLQSTPFDFLSVSIRDVSF
ncbi:MAG: hypothetical protein E8D48_08380 [Nitrospira sp.]|nr:MAG: hypothetical protein E8D48_08380 [Nitrospira sp.]